MTNISAVEKMAELMQQMEENSPRVAALQYCLSEVSKRITELEQKLAESQREFRAADATIENLQMQLNAEREAKSALAAENIDKRALREAAEKAGTDSHTQDEWFHYLRCSTPATVLALLDEIAELEQGHCGTALLEREEMHAKTLGRMLDELEAKDKRIAELSQKADIYDMLRQDYELQGSLVDFVDWQAKRIAYLESREVKFPELKMLRDYLAEVTHREREDILVGVRLEFFRALEEAGVKVAAAGKGE